MTANRGAIIAALVSPMAILFVPVLLSLFALYDYDASVANSMDDALIRAARVILFVLAPIAYPVLIVTVFISTWLLKRLRLLSKRSLTVLVLALSVVIGVFLGLRSPFGVRDQLIGVGVFASLFTACLGLGAIVWWLIGKPRHNEGLHPIAEKASSG
jgi:hypothetical protein